MRKIAIISAVATILLFSFATRTYATCTDNEHLSALQSLISREIPYDANTPIDSIISWTNQLAPTLKFPRTEESYFTLLLWQVSAYIMRGDLSLAVDRARYMYESAKDMNSNFGIALANQAIGQAYTASYIQDKALSSYLDALHHLSPNNPQTYRLLVKISTLFATDEPIGRGHDVCKSPEPTSGTAARTSVRHSILIENATYYISSGDQQTGSGICKRQIPYIKTILTSRLMGSPSTIIQQPATVHWQQMIMTSKKQTKHLPFTINCSNWFPATNVPWSIARFLPKRYICINYWGALMRLAGYIRSYIPLLTLSLRKVTSAR